MNTLAKIQAELKAPKNQKNTFGNYNYRSCEDILEAVKPLLKKHDALLTISDTIEEVGGRIYVKATCRFQGNDGCSAEVTAYAREAETKKGMDESQITGATSSYARKYALNGLFCIDDTKDADAHAHETPHNAAQELVTKDQVFELEKIMSDVKADRKAFCAYFKVSKVDELPAKHYASALKALEAKRKAA